MEIKRIKEYPICAFLSTGDGNGIWLDDIQIEEGPEPDESSTLFATSGVSLIHGIVASQTFTFTCELDKYNGRLLGKFVPHSLEIEYRKRVECYKTYRRCVHYVLTGRTKLIRKRNSTRIRREAKKALKKWGISTMFYKIERSD